MRIKDMPLNFAELFDGAAHCKRVIESLKDYSNYCKKHRLKPNIEEAIKTAICMCDNLISKISVQNKILNRPEWKDKLEFGWRIGRSKRNRFKRCFFLVLDDLQSMIDDAKTEYLPNDNQQPIGFTLGETK